MSKRSWCDTCRGDGSSSDTLLRCSSCPRRFHTECAGLKVNPGDGWVCHFCDAENSSDASHSKSGAKTNIKKRVAAIRKCHHGLKNHCLSYLEGESSKLEPFVSAAWLKQLHFKNQSRILPANALQIDSSPPFVHAVLRPYQVAGVNWLLSRYAYGSGGIVADEMGLGKTIQSLTFLAALKDKGLSGPHLVVTPLAVLQNWANEIKRFTPGLTHIKVHGNASERDRLLSRDDVVSGEFDIYLTTYDTFLSEEAFFTESFLFHTIIVDEGHRLKNPSSKLCNSLQRLASPFRVLLTGTPLQNNLAELMALLQYVLPNVPVHEHLLFPPTSTSPTELNCHLIGQARTLLDSCMIRRIKSEVEAALLPKIEYLLKPPLTRIQRKWYRSFLESDGSFASGMLTQSQLLSKMMQLRKVANHPKTFALTYDRDRLKHAGQLKQAEGSMFVKLDSGNIPRTPEAIAMEAELRGLTKEKLISSSGKLALLDRLLLAKQREGSRVLIFTQFTLTLDVLEEYVKYRIGRVGVAYLRLDGKTNRIQREMDMRSFNKPGCEIFCYLISTMAGGQGINLATADTVVLYDTCWNPQVDLQAQDRAHRIGQKKQVIIYRLISENTMEERILARARQKMVLDALVTKKYQDGDGPLVDTLVNEDNEEGEGGMTKLSVEELWKMLSEGAAQVFDPAADKSKDFEAKDYDRLICEAKPAKWDDKTTGENIDNVPPLKGRDQSELDGTIFAKSNAAKIRPAVDNDNAIDLLSSDDEIAIECTTLVQSACSEPHPQTLSNVCAVEDTDSMLIEPRRGKRARAPRILFVARIFDTDSRKKHPKIKYDQYCFSCRQPCLVESACSERNPQVLSNVCTVEDTDSIPIEPRRSKRARAPPTMPNDSRAVTEGPLQCSVCPHVYHAGCSGQRTRPKSKTWYCPWHHCKTCKRKSSAAGGTLFHCVSCPLTYCFDCSPDEYTEGGQSTSNSLHSSILERRGMRALKSYMFFTCSDCEKVKLGLDVPLTPTSKNSLMDYYKVCSNVKAKSDSKECDNNVDDNDDVHSDSDSDGVINVHSDNNSISDEGSYNDSDSDLT